MTAPLPDYKRERCDLLSQPPGPVAHHMPAMPHRCTKAVEIASLLFLPDAPAARNSAQGGHVGHYPAAELLVAWMPGKIDRKPHMDWNRVEGNWKQIKGKVKEKWGKLTDDDLTAIAGNRDQLEGKIQERYGIAKDQVRKDVDDWYSSQSW